MRSQLFCCPLSGKVTVTTWGLVLRVLVWNNKIFAGEDINIDFDTTLWNKISFLVSFLSLKGKYEIRHSCTWLDSLTEHMLGRDHRPDLPVEGFAVTIETILSTRMKCSQSFHLQNCTFSMSSLLVFHNQNQHNCISNGCFCLHSSAGHNPLLSVY